MKKLALLLALILVPCSAFGMEMLNDSAMDQITGQSGVSIAADDIQIFLNVEKFAWVDCDGYGTELAYGGVCESTLGAAVVVENFQMDTLNINMIGGRGIAAATQTGDIGANGNQTSSARALAGSTCGQIYLFYDYGAAATTGCGLDSQAGSTMGLDNYTNTNVWQTNSGFMAKSLTIDATAELPLHSAGWQGNHAGALGSALGFTTGQTIAGVLIGLPTMEIYIHDMSFTPRVSADILTNDAADEALVYNNNESFGTIVMQGVTFTLLNGFVEFAPTGRQGDGL